MTLPKAISDAIDAYRFALWVGDGDEGGEARAALERAIADHVSPVDAPTEAEIEAWEKEARANDVSVLPDTHPGEFYQVRGRCIEQAVALMRRAAAATPAPSR